VGENGELSRSGTAPSDWLVVCDLTSPSSSSSSIAVVEVVVVAAWRSGLWLARWLRSTKLINVGPG